MGKYPRTEGWGATVGHEDLLTPGVESVRHPLDRKASSQTVGYPTTAGITRTS